MDTPWQQRSIEASFLRSAMSSQGLYQSTAAFLDWFQARQTASRFTVEQIPFEDFDQWYFCCIENGSRTIRRRPERS